MARYRNDRGGNPNVVRFTNVERLAIERGLQEGLQQEASAILKRQLTKRFGALAKVTV